MITPNSLHATLRDLALLALAVVTAGMMAMPESALALQGQGHQFLASASNPFNASDNPNFTGGFGIPVGMAVDNSTNPADPSAGDVYVADQGNSVMDKLTPGGVFISQIVPPAGVNGTPELAGVAVDLRTGDVYVADGHNNVVDKFDATGAYLSQIDGVTAPGVAPGGFHDPRGVAVDTQGNVYVTSFGFEETQGREGRGTVDEFDSSGAYVSQIANLVVPKEVAVDDSSESSDPSAGDVYVIERNEVLENEPGGEDKADSHEQLVKYSPSHTFLSVIDNGIQNSDKFNLVHSNAVAIGPSGEVYSERFNGPASTSYVQEFDVSGSPFFEFGSGLLSVSLGIAINTTTGNVYVSETNTPGVAVLGINNVVIFSPFTFVVPVVTSQAASSLLPESAVFNGTVNPNDLDTKYHVEFWTASDPEHHRSAPVDVGTGFETHSFIQVLSGLTPNTTYHAVVIATNAVGASIPSAEQTFTTGALPAPEASTGGASEITPYTATITGTLNPNAVETTYHFDIGADTSYGAQVYGSGIFASATPITQTLQNLQPGTTYHYRFVASNQTGIVYGADQTFTTTALPQAVSAPTALPFIAYPSIAFPKEAQPATKKPAKRCKNGFVKKKGKCVRKPKSKGKKKTRGK